MKRRSRFNTESSSVFYYAALGVQTLQRIPFSLKNTSRFREQEQQIKTLAPVNSQVSLETMQALYGFPTVHPPTLGSLLDTSGESLFCFSHRTV